MLSRPARASRTLRAAELRGAEYFGVIALDPASGALLGGTWTPQLQDVKRFVLRNRSARFEFHVWAGPATASRIIAQLGQPDGYDSDYSRVCLSLLNQLATVTERVAIVAPQEGIYAWRRVTLHFSRDPSAGATIRRAVVILTARPAARKSADPASLSKSVSP